MSPDDLRALPVTVNLSVAGRAFGLGRDASYTLAARDEFPVPVLRLGRRRVVTRAAILNALGVPDLPSKPLAGAATPQVNRYPADS